MSDRNDAELIRELGSRFPIFDEVSGRFGEDLPEERIPWFFALLLAAAMKGEPGACCFVLNKTEGTTALTALLVAFARLKEDFPRLAEEYARTELSKGQRVRVKPSDFVYEYDGIWEEFPGRFRLRVLDKADLRSFWISEALRLEPTTRKRPKGALSSKLGVFELSILDGLLGIASYGNDSVIRNVVLLYMAQAHFERIAEIVSLTPAGSNRSDLLSSFLPWGSIGPGGEIATRDAYQVIGEPLVAVSRALPDLAGAVKSASEASKIVLVDGARGAASDLQAFDDIASRHRVVVLASPDEVEEIRFLRDRECPVWYLSPTEIKIGEGLAGERSRKSLVGRTVRAADIREGSRVISIDCQSDELEAVAEALERVAAKVGGTEERSEVDGLLGRLYGILLEFSECCFGVGEEVKSNLGRAREDLVRGRTWMDPEVAREFQGAIDRLESISCGGSGLTGKADALKSELSELDGRWAVATRSVRTAECIREGLSGLGSDSPVLPIREIRSEDEWDRIILPAWPVGRRLTRLKNLGVTRDIRVLTYPFERRWLLSHENSERSFMGSNQMGAEERAGILGIDSGLLPKVKPPEPISPGGARPDPPMLNFERRYSWRGSSHGSAPVDGDDVRSARLVEFYGGCYTLLTEWSQLDVLNKLIGGGLGDGGSLLNLTASKLSPGDVALFRAGGDKGFIRQLAEEELGIAEYGRVRTIAERWKKPLRRLGGDPAEVQRRLEGYGLRRGFQTISGWMWDPDRIGPGYDSDIEVIGRASADRELLSELDSVREAISRIRGVHTSAGRRLTRLILGEVRDHLNQFDGQPVQLDLGYGQAWVVEVATIDAQEQEYPADQVNRLLWEEDFGF